MTKYDKDVLDWEYVDRVLGVERCSWCDEPATIARGTADARCAEHDAQWFDGPARLARGSYGDLDGVREALHSIETFAAIVRDAFHGCYPDVDTVDPGTVEVALINSRNVEHYAGKLRHEVEQYIARS